MRLIDADMLDACKFHPLPYAPITPTDADAESYKRGWNDAIDAIVSEAPTVDEIVHCKDCIFASPYIYCGEVYLTCDSAEGLNRDVSEHSFCSAAIERKESG